jgi:hypothetical protein
MLVVVTIEQVCGEVPHVRSPPVAYSTSNVEARSLRTPFPVVCAPRCPMRTKNVESHKPIRSYDMNYVMNAR